MVLVVLSGLCYIFSFSFYTSLDAGFGRMGGSLIPVRPGVRFVGKLRPARQPEVNTDPRVIVGSITRQPMVGGLSEAGRASEAQACCLSERSQ